MHYQRTAIDEIKSNPNNPRIIKDSKYKQLVKSIKEFPEMLELRPIVCNDDMVVLGGNMRLRACQDAGLTHVPVIKASQLSEAQQREFTIKDNVGYGEWDWEKLNDDWNVHELRDWGLDVPNFEGSKLEEFEVQPLELGWFLNIEFQTESECQQWYDKLVAEGLVCKIVQ